MSYTRETISYRVVISFIPIQQVAAANLARAQRSDAGDGGNDLGRDMDPDEARDYADQGPLPDRDLAEDKILAKTFETYAVFKLSLPTSQDHCLY